MSMCPKLRRSVVILHRWDYTQASPGACAIRCDLTSRGVDDRQLVGPSIKAFARALDNRRTFDAAEHR